MALLRPVFKVIVGVNITALLLLVGTSLYASDALVVAPSSHSEILNHKQSEEAAHANRGAWLLLASADIDDDAKDCETRRTGGECEW
ncbi:MAG: hypothetical protein IID32_12770, partial [Planctomycetes bacterium]|nr:hypothetical protein [Planctomycetota bacterium]